MSLQSTYQSRKALLVENLETMGVTGYDETDGLTTLINAVLEIGPTPPTPTPASIDLVATNSILSYADGDTTVLTATVLDSNDDPVENATVELYKAGTLWDTLTTDSSGECTKTYTSAGIGDVSFEAKCNLLTKTYDIEDCINYDAMTSNSGKWTIPSACSTAYDSNGAKFGTATSYSQVKLTDKLTAPCSVEFTLVDYNSDWNDSPSLLIFQYTNGETTPNQQLLSGGFATKRSFTVFGTTTINHVLVKGAKYKIEYGSSTMKVYENGTQLASTSNTVGLPTKFEYHIGTGGNRWLKVKDVKVKPL